MARYRIVRRPDPERILSEKYEVEEFAPYLDEHGTAVAHYWSFVSSFDNFDDACIFTESIRAMAGSEVIKEYD